jgi:hypothetical protein
VASAPPLLVNGRLRSYSSVVSFLAGTPSDDVPGILAAGRSDITNLFVSMSARHPDGEDADYLRWHSFDCRPEQHRIPAIRASLRFVSTPECRRARAASEGRYDAVDHIMTYFFADVAGLEPFTRLTEALRAAGRKPYMDGHHGRQEVRVLPQLEMGLYEVDGMAAASRIKIGAEVLPWWPLQGGYILVERGKTPAWELTEVAGVGGAWWGSTVQADAGLSAEVNEMADADLVTGNLHITYCFLDDDPVATAERLHPVVHKRWTDKGIVPLLAAPFHVVLGHQVDLHLP